MIAIAIKTETTIDKTNTTLANCDVVIFPNVLSSLYIREGTFSLKRSLLFLNQLLTVIISSKLWSIKTIKKDKLHI